MELNIVQIADPHAYSPFPASPFMAEGAGSDTRMEDWVNRHRDVWQEADIFVIDAMFSFFERDTDSFGGIKLLKLLRLSGFRQHCILYSFPSLQKILTISRHNTILLSCGTTYVKLPDPVDKKLCQEKYTQPCEENMLPYFQSEALEWLGTRRHSLANWWGLLRMYEVLDGCGLIGSDIPQGLQDTLRRNSSYEGQLMNFVRFNGRLPRYSISADRAQVLLGRMRALWKKNLKVVYVDDCAEDGWSYLLQLVLYGKVRSDLFIVPQLPMERLDVEALSQDIVKEKPDLVLLDIRLTPEDELADPSKLSGIALTSELVNVSNTCPILIMTASNKRIVSEKALAAGADAVWTKEGIEEGRSFPVEKYPIFSTNRIQELVMQLRRLIGFDFSLLYDGLKRFKEIESSEEVYWWEKSRWFPDDNQERTPLEKTLVVEELKKLFMAHKQFLSATQAAVKHSAYDMLTIKLCRILEILHPTGFGTSQEVQTLGRVAFASWPAFSVAVAYAMYLINTRNEVVHYNGRYDFARNDALQYKNTMDAFFDYLTLTNPSERPGWIECTITRKTSETGNVSYQFKGGPFFGKFNKGKDIQACDKILGTRESASNVQVALSRPVADFELGAIRLVEQFEEDYANYWTATFSVLQTSGWKAVLSLNSIIPRKRLNFCIHAKDVAAIVKENDRLYFFPKWKDLPEGKPTCLLQNVQLTPPKRSRYTYWTGRVSGVLRSDKGTFVLLTDIKPPFNARFHAFAEFLNEPTEIQPASRICFRPDFAQEWLATNPIWKPDHRRSED